MKGRARVSDSTQEEGKEEKGCSTAASAASLGFLYIGSRIRLSFSRCSRSLPPPGPPGRRMTVRVPRRFDHSGKGWGEGELLVIRLHGLIPIVSSVFHVRRVFRVERPTCSERYANDVEG